MYNKTCVAAVATVRFVDFLTIVYVIKKKHCRFVKQLLKYIKSTRNYALIYPKSNTTIVTGYSDSDHAGYLDDRKST